MHAGVVRVHEATFEIGAGEIVGIAAVEGSGQRELLRALAGRLAPPRRAYSSDPAVVGFVPEDRHHDAVLLDRSLVGKRRAPRRRRSPRDDRLERGRRTDRAPHARLRRRALRARALRCERSRVAINRSSCSARELELDRDVGASARRRESDSRSRRESDRRRTRTTSQSGARRRGDRALLERHRRGAPPREPCVRRLRSASFASCRSTASGSGRRWSAPRESPRHAGTYSRRRFALVSELVAGDRRDARDRRHDGAPPVRGRLPRRCRSCRRSGTGRWAPGTRSPRATLVRAVPLMLTGVAVAIAFRAGVLNIGAEGQLLAGAAAATIGALSLGQWPAGRLFVVLLALAASAARRRDLGVHRGLPARSLRRARGHQHDHAELRRAVRRVLSRSRSASGADSRVSPDPRRSPTRSISLASPVPDACTRASRWRSASALVAGWMLRRTAAGFRLIAAGESPSAATSAGGIDVMGDDDACLPGERRARGTGWWRRGSRRHLRSLREHLAGLRLHGDRRRAAGRLDPWRVVATAVLFGALEAGAGAMQRDAGVPSTLVVGDRGSAHSRRGRRTGASDARRPSDPAPHVSGRSHERRRSSPFSRPRSARPCRSLSPHSVSCSSNVQD